MMAVLAVRRYRSPTCRDLLHGRHHRNDAAAGVDMLIGDRPRRARGQDADFRFLTRRKHNAITTGLNGSLFSIHFERGKSQRRRSAMTPPVLGGFERKKRAAMQTASPRIPA